ncbi:MAG TPA: DUF2188 domain-containing protein [Candidatus Polarisedimenticolaceae bacterium]|nr:DUF2188 domain-containing protein [Candidatus Polarisedimenticolaceae bacterium]
MSDKDRHVVPQDGDWVVKKPGAERASSIHDTQAAAIDHAREIAQTTGGEVVIHGRDGRIRDKDSYGRDPNPPKDKKH